MYTLVLMAATITPGQPAINSDGLGQASDKPFNKQANNAEARKDARDLVLRSVGNDALAFTKQYGDLGIFTLQQVKPETGKRLVKLFNEGALSKLKNPKAALEAVRQNGDQAGVWMCDHLEQLADPEALECWCKNPMEFVYDLKDVQLSAEELRASRKSSGPWMANLPAEWNIPYIVIGILVLLLLLALLWKRRPPAM